jgi:hypothetical protein
MDMQTRIFSLVLLVPIINWILGPLFAIWVAWILLCKRQYMDIVVGCALAVVWFLASLWMWAFYMRKLGSLTVPVAIVWFIAFYFYNRFLLNWFSKALERPEPGTVKITGSIRS